MNFTEVYRENIKKYEAKLSGLKQDYNRISILRLFVFILSAILLLYLFISGLFLPFFIVLLISIIGFGLILKHHSKIAYLRKQTAFLKKINEWEILREKCQLEEFETGNEFLDQSHPYTSDLDIFGEHSIFQLINRATTESGKIHLSEWLSKPASKPEIQDRQEAIKELSKKPDWRQDFQATGMHFINKKSDYLRLLEWVEKPVVLYKTRHLYRAAAIILPVLFLLSTYYFYANLDAPSLGVIGLALMFLVLIINWRIIKKLTPMAEEIVETSTNNFTTLRGYQALIRKIETENFQAKKLQALQAVLKHGKYSAFREINKICSTLDYSHQRPVKKSPISGNVGYALLNSFLLLDIHLILETEKWKLKNKEFLRSWAEVVSEFEVICSFAGFCFSNPSFSFPEITEKDNYVHFKSLGHPLINSEERVNNDFHSEDSGNVVMITGSNMAGKSTFLRAVGVNLVLALAGAPCCAKSGQVSQLKVFTSMRTQDNLMKGISSFYAELNRIEQMLKLIQSSKNIFFLLDEMFKGTNSEDRHKGGYSLIAQVSELDASGIIATHDIDLAKLAGNKNLVTNYSFNSKIKDGAMIFSYKLHPDICFDFNASELMKKSGIKILSNISAEGN